MTYKIFYNPKNSEENKEYIMLEVELWMPFVDVENDLWATDVKGKICAEGFTHFLKDIKNPGFDYEKFIVRVNDIVDINFYLNEFWNNKPRLIDESKEFYNNFRQTLEDKLRNFTMLYTDCRIKIY